MAKQFCDVGTMTWHLSLKKIITFCSKIIYCIFFSQSVSYLKQQCKKSLASAESSAGNGGGFLHFAILSIVSS